MIWRIIFWIQRINEKFSLTKKIFRQSNQLFSNLFSKPVNFTKFLPKMRETIPVISTLWHCTAYTTVYYGNFLYFSVTHILREINFDHFAVTKNFHRLLEILNFDFEKFSGLYKIAKNQYINIKWNKFRAPKIEPPKSSKMISRKISLIFRKELDFHTLCTMSHTQYFLHSCDLYLTSKNEVHPSTWIWVGSLIGFRKYYRVLCPR